MTVNAHALKLLLDEHYPAWLAEQLTEAGIDTAAVVARLDLRGVDDTTVLRVASREQRAVVTEDVTTLSIAMNAVPDHAGVIFCHHARFPRTRPGLAALRTSLEHFAADQPLGARSTPFVWWLSN
ncbi:MAG: DUF5615 family PIN-like protein [Leucobacter sp.]